MRDSDDIRRDLALLARIVARDQTALGEQYDDRHRRLLFGLILRIVRERGDAEEVLQEGVGPLARSRGQAAGAHDTDAFARCRR